MLGLDYYECFKATSLWLNEISFEKIDDIEVSS